MKIRVSAQKHFFLEKYSIFLLTASSNLNVLSSMRHSCAWTCRKFHTNLTNDWFLGMWKNEYQKCAFGKIECKYQLLLQKSLDSLHKTGERESLQDLLEFFRILNFFGSEKVLQKCSIWSVFNLLVLFYLLNSRQN